MKRTTFAALCACLAAASCATAQIDGPANAACARSRAGTERVVRSLYDAMGRGDTNAVSALYAENVDFRDPTLGFEFNTRAQVVDEFRQSRGRYQEVSFDLRDIVLSECNRAAVLGRARAQYRGQPIEADFLAIIDVRGAEITRQRDFYPRYPLTRRIREIDVAAAPSN